MSNNIRKSSLEQAKSDFEEIRNFAQQQLESKLQEEVDKKISQIINEDINISIDEEGNVDVTKDGEEVVSLENSGEFETFTSNEEDVEDTEDDFIEVSDDDEPIEVSDEELTNENMLEMDYMKNEAEANLAPAQTPAPEAVPAVATDAPAVDTELEAPQEDVAEEGQGEIDELISKMDTLINVLMQQQGISSDQQGGDQEFEIIDDEEQGAPEAQGAPAPAPAPAPELDVPVQEELQFEIEDFEETDGILEIVDDELFEDEDIETITIVDEDQLPEEGDGLDEMLGVGQALKRSNKLGKSPRQGVEHREEINENKNIKAQYESKLGELTKENRGLKSELGTLQLERKEFEDAFIQLREQFDEMQTFNGKLALVNKLLMNGGLSFEQKLNVCEQFDDAGTIEEAEKIYKNIIKENNIKVGDASSKIKASTTHTAKPTLEAKPLYENAEAKRMRELAGMDKRSEN